MAVIDLRNSDVFISDGTSESATTTLSAASSKGAETITLTSAVGFSVGQGITLGTSLEYYAIQSISGSVVTVSPPLTEDFASSSTVTAIANMIEVKVGEGTLTYSEKRAVTYVLNRSRIYTVKLGDDAPVEVSLDIIWEFLRSASGKPPTVEEALKNIGNASNWVSSSSDPCEPYSVDINICNIPPCGDTELVQLKYYRWESLDHDLKAGTLNTKGNCNIAFATVTHGSN